ncbi:unnamed protein product [Cochlearia groenlandica]
MKTLLVFIGKRKCANRSRRTNSLVQLPGDHWTEYPRAVSSSSSSTVWSGDLETAGTGTASLLLHSRSAV